MSMRPAPEWADNAVSLNMCPFLHDWRFIAKNESARNGDLFGNQHGRYLCIAERSSPTQWGTWSASDACGACNSKVCAIPRWAAGRTILSACLSAAYTYLLFAASMKWFAWNVIQIVFKWRSRCNFQQNCLVMHVLQPSLVLYPSTRGLAKRRCRRLGIGCARGDTSTKLN